MKDNISYITSIGEKYTILTDGTATELTVAQQINGLLVVTFTNKNNETATARISEYSLFTLAKQYCNAACENETEQMAMLLNIDAASVEDNIRYCGFDMPEEVEAHTKRLYELREQSKKYEKFTIAIEEERNERKKKREEMEKRPLRHIMQSIKAFTTTAATCMMTSYILSLLLPLTYQIDNVWWIVALAATIIPLFIYIIHKTIATFPQIASTFIIWHKPRAIPSILLFSSNAAWLVFLCFGSDYDKLSSTQFFTSVINAITIISIYTRYINNIMNYEETPLFVVDDIRHSGYLIYNPNRLGEA